MRAGGNGKQAFEPLFGAADRLKPGPEPDDVVQGLHGASGQQGAGRKPAHGQVPVDDQIGAVSDDGDDGQLAHQKGQVAQAADPLVDALSFDGGVQIEGFIAAFGNGLHRLRLQQRQSRQGADDVVEAAVVGPLQAFDRRGQPIAEQGDAQAVDDQQGDENDAQFAAEIEHHGDEQQNERQIENRDIGLAAVIIAQLVQGIEAVDMDTAAFLLEGGEIAPEKVADGGAAGLVFETRTDHRHEMGPRISHDGIDQDRHTHAQDQKRDCS